MASATELAVDSQHDTDVPDSDFTGKVIGIAYKIHNQLGSGYQEKYYQRAFAAELVQEGLTFQRELPYPIVYQGKKIGRYKVDFLVDDRLVVELKRSNGIYEKHFSQVLGYLKHSGVRLALLVCFGEDRVLVKRIIYTPSDETE